ncbi:MAG: transposase family protein [Blastocatellia bacterium]
MWINVPSLQESLADADLYEFRQSQGKRYELQSVLLLSCVAMMNGAQSEQEIADWCSQHGRRWLKWLGVKNEKGPSAATVTRIFRGVEGGRLEAAVILWAQQVLESLRLSSPLEEDEWDEVAFEIETASIATKRWALGSELLCALGLRLRSLLKRLTGLSEYVGGEIYRESLLVGLTLTGYLETNDLGPDRRGAAVHLPKSEEIPYLPAPAMAGQLWQRLPA